MYSKILFMIKYLGLILALFFISIAGCMAQNDSKTKMSFDQQMEVFNSLGYKFNKGITKEVIFSEMMKYDQTIKDPEQLFIKEPYKRLYYYLG